MTPTKGPSYNYDLSDANRQCLTCPLPYGCNEANPLCPRQAWLRTQRPRRPLISDQVIGHLTKTEQAITVPDLARALDRKPASVHSAVRQLQRLAILATIPASPEPGQRYIRYYIKEQQP